MRYKGRNLRIKAPMCRALKKLCDPEGKTGNTYQSVQSLDTESATVSWVGLLLIDIDMTEAFLYFII